MPKQAKPSNDRIQERLQDIITAIYGSPWPGLHEGPLVHWGDAAQFGRLLATIPQVFPVWPDATSPLYMEKYDEQLYRIAAWILSNWRVEENENSLTCPDLCGHTRRSTTESMVAMAEAQARFRPSPRRRLRGFAGDGKVIIYDEVCMQNNLDPKVVARLAKRISKAIKEANSMGLIVFGGGN